MGATASALHPESDILKLPKEDFSLPHDFFLSVAKSDPANEAVSYYFYPAIHQLPNEILLEIFSYLTVPEVCRYVVPVCKKWRDLGHDISLWKSLKLGNGWSATKCFDGTRIQNLVKKSPLLKVFEYHSSKHINRIILNLSIHCSKLEVLELQCKALSLKTVEKLAIGCQNIRQISFHKIDGDDHTNYLPLANLKHLTALEFSFCHWADDNFITAMSKNCANLQYLNLHKLPFVSDKSVSILLSQCKKSLKTLMLCLGAVAITDNVFNEIAQCTFLEKLTCVPSYLVTDASFVQIENLQELVSISFCRLWMISAVACRSVFNKPCWNKLKDADFVYSDCIDDIALENLARNAPNLQTLLLERCLYITDQGINGVLTHCKNLAYLNLERMHSLKGSFLLHIHKKLPNLVVLRVDHCDSIDQVLLGSLSRARSRLNIFTEESTVYSEMETSLMEYPATHQARFQVKFQDLNVKKEYPVELSALVSRRNIS